MACGTHHAYLRFLAVSVIRGVLLVVVLPLFAAILCAQPLTSTSALITSTLVIEYGAAPIGIGFGLHPVFVLLVLVSVALGITLFLFDLLDLLARHSERVARFLARSEQKAKQSSFFSRYGIWGLVPCVITLGFYVCPPVAWACAWRRDSAVLLIMAGFIAISGVLILATLGLFSIIFP